MSKRRDREREMLARIEALEEFARSFKNPALESFRVVDEPVRCTCASSAVCPYHHKLSDYLHSGMRLINPKETK